MHMGGSIWGRLPVENRSNKHILCMRGLGLRAIDVRLRKQALGKQLSLLTRYLTQIGELRAILLPAEMFVSELISKQSRKLTNGGAPISQRS
jgi:hypothetical protein